MEETNNIDILEGDVESTMEEVPQNIQSVVVVAEQVPKEEIQQGSN